MLNLFCCFSRRAHSEPTNDAASERAPVLERPAPPPKPIMVRHTSSHRARVESAGRRVQVTATKPPAKRKPVPRVMSVDSFDGAIARQIAASFAEPAGPSPKALGKRPMRYLLHPEPLPAAHERHASDHRAPKNAGHNNRRRAEDGNRQPEVWRDNTRRIKPS